MTEIEQLRAELAELREAMQRMFVVTTSVLAASPNSATALVGLLAHVGEVQQQLEKDGRANDAFDTISVATLRALSSIALKQYPQDQEVRFAYEGLRPGARH